MITLKKGSRGNSVKYLQSKLNIKEDGIFGYQTEEAVKQFQKNNNLNTDGIVGPKTWEKIEMIKKRNIKEIIVHCSATPEGKNYTVDQIKQWHLARGFSDIGYHYIIYLDGSTHQGRQEDAIGAHCTNHNSNSIGVCYIGGVAKDGKTPKDTRTDAQKKSLLTLLKSLKQKYPKAVIYPHYKFANKACPSFNAEEEYKNI